MAPLPPNSTKRYWLDYTVCGFQHSLEMRTTPLVAAGTASIAFNDLLTELDPVLFALTVDGMRVAALGSNLSFPAVYSGGTSFGAGAGSGADTAAFASWIGRSSGGRRAHCTVFGVIGVASGGNWRASPGEVPSFDDALAFLNSNSQVFLAIDGGVPTRNNYTNTGYNAYWRNKVR